MKWSEFQLIVLVFFVGDSMLSGAGGFHDGAPRSSCEELRPIHRPHEPQRTPNPYRIRFKDDVVDYRCGDTIRIQISTASAHEGGGFRGFVLQGRDESGVVQGVFDTEASSRGVRAVSCVAGNDTVTHSNPSVKQFVDLIWNSPDRCSSNDIYFRGAVVRQTSIFWTDWNVKLPFRVTTSTVVSEL